MQLFDTHRRLAPLCGCCCCLLLFVRCGAAICNRRHRCHSNRFRHASLHRRVCRPRSMHAAPAAEVRPTPLPPPPPPLLLPLHSRALLPLLVQLHFSLRWPVTSIRTSCAHPFTHCERCGERCTKEFASTRRVRLKQIKSAGRSSGVRRGQGAVLARRIDHCSAFTFRIRLFFVFSCRYRDVALVGQVRHARRALPHVSTHTRTHTHMQQRSAYTYAYTHTHTHICGAQTHTHARSPSAAPSAPVRPMQST